MRFAMNSKLVNAMGKMKIDLAGMSSRMSTYRKIGDYFATGPLYSPLNYDATNLHHPIESMETTSFGRHVLESRKYTASFPSAINKYCDQCAHAQNWKAVGNTTIEFNDGNGFLSELLIHTLEYECKNCSARVSYFFTLVGDASEGTLVKVGQHPELSVKIAKELAKSLGEDAQLYRRAVMCRHNSFGSRQLPT